MSAATRTREKIPALRKHLWPVDNCEIELVTTANYHRVTTTGGNAHLARDLHSYRRNTPRYHRYHHFSPHPIHEALEKERDGT